MYTHTVFTRAYIHFPVICMYVCMNIHIHVSFPYMGGWVYMFAYAHFCWCVCMGMSAQYIGCTTVSCLDLRASCVRLRDLHVNCREANFREVKKYAVPWPENLVECLGPPFLARPQTIYFC